MISPRSPRWNHHAHDQKTDRPERDAYTGPMNEPERELVRDSREDEQPTGHSPIFEPSGARTQDGEEYRHTLNGHARSAAGGRT